MGSIAGKEVYPNGSVYCSSKFGVDAFTQGLRLDLSHLGIKVSAINPGLVNTEFSEVRFKGDKSKASWTTTIAVFGYVYVLNFSVRTEQIHQISIGGIKR